MKRRQRTIRGVDDDAWEMLREVAELNRIARGALIAEAIRFWYDSLDGDDENVHSEQAKLTCLK